MKNKRTHLKYSAREVVRERWLNGVVELTVAEVVLLFDLRLVASEDPRRDTLTQASARCAVRVGRDAVYLRCMNRTWFERLVREQRAQTALDMVFQTSV